MNKEKTANNKAKTANKNFVLCSLFFILCIVACGEEETELYTAGRLTITGLDAFNGQEIFACYYRMNPPYLNLDAYGRVIGHNSIAGKIASNQATLNVYEDTRHGGSDIHGTKYRGWSNYNGNDQNIKFAVAIIGTAYGYVTVNFANGIASGVFEKAPFINWYLNGGSKGSGTYPWQIEKGTKLYKPSPDPTRSGYTFDGWYTDSALTQEYNFADSVTADLSLYAKWKEPSQEDVYGTWGNASYLSQFWTLTISATSVRLQNNKGEYVQYSNVTWTPAENKNSYYQTQYPNGYSFNGNHTYSGLTGAAWYFSFVALSTNGQSVYLSSGNRSGITFTK